MKKNNLKILFENQFLALILLTNIYISQAQMIFPSNLQKGDTVAIVATARKNITDNLAPTKALLKSWGLNYVIGKTIGLDHHQLAGTDEERASDFQEMMDNPNIKAIWCVRGGYGTVKMLDYIDFSNFIKNPKWIIGFSDVTVLHSQLNTLQIASIHAIMPINVVTATLEAKESLRKSLFGETITYQEKQHSKNKLGTAKGTLVGGNLSILYSLMGSQTQIDCSNKILFIEDLDEYLYHIDRMLMNLKRCGCFDELQGLIIGSMSKMRDNDIPWGKNAYEIIEEIVSPYNFPVIYDFQAGHINNNKALIFGKTISLEANEEVSIIKF